MFNGLLLKVTETDNAAGEDWPKFFFLKFPFLGISLIDLVLKSSFCKLKEDIDLIEGGAVLIFNLSDDFIQGYDVLASIKLVLPLLQKLDVSFILLLVVECELTKQEIGSCLLLLQEE